MGEEAHEAKSQDEENYKQEVAARMIMLLLESMFTQHMMRTGGTLKSPLMTGHQWLVHGILSTILINGVMASV